MLHHSESIPLCLQDTVVAIRRGGDSLIITSMHPDKYPESTFSVDPDQVGLDASGRLGA